VTRARGTSRRLSHIDLWWEGPLAARFFRRLASFARSILLEKRGLGPSDRPVGFPALEERMDDIRSVMDAAQSDSPTTFGVSEGGAVAAVGIRTRAQLGCPIPMKLRLFL
jgi:pimeloyl-ACP methyl ester carboxylesterase